MEKKKIKILIVDDHLLVRSGIKSLLDDQSDMEISSEASSGEEAVEKARAIRPDVILMDISLPGISGLEAAEIIKQELPSTAVVILTMHDEREYVYNTLKMNIDGLLHKSASKQEIVAAIRSAASGEKFYGSTVSEMLVDHFVDRFKIDEINNLVLTKREKEIVYLLAQGLSTSEIAERLSVSPRTIDTHRSNLIQKLNLNNSADLVRFCVEFIKKLPGK